MHLDCLLTRPPGLGGPPGPAALLRDGWEGGSREAQERERTQRVAVGRQEAEGAPKHSEEGMRALSGSAPASAAVRSTALQSSHCLQPRAPAAPLCSSLELCSCLAGGVGVRAVFCVYFF